MFFWIILALSPFLMGLFFPPVGADQRRPKGYYVSCGLILVLVLGLRHYDMGSGDTKQYLNSMSRAILSDSWFQYTRVMTKEYGFWTFVYFLSRIFDSPQWLLVFTSAFYALGVFYVVEKNSCNIPLAITLYICLGLMSFQMQGMRQAMAMVFCMFAYEPAKQGKLLLFLFWIAIAATFHQTAILFLPAFALCRLKFSFRNILLVVIASATAMYAFNGLLDIANETFNKNYKTHTFESSSGVVAVTIYLLTIIASLLYYISHKKEASPAPFYLLLAGFGCYLMRFTGSMIAERVATYYAFTQLILIPQAIHLLPKNCRTLPTIAVVMLAISLLLYRWNGTNFIPYRFFWDF